MGHGGGQNQETSSNCGTRGGSELPMCLSEHATTSCHVLETKHIVLSL